ncbi:MAG: hypothetical protein IKS45_12115, partial [Thermoguttaceae bacterium]|nr:hypothetical protein [Thermoguttaceae bacterium]
VSTLCLHLTVYFLLALDQLAITHYNYALIPAHYSLPISYFCLYWEKFPIQPLDKTSKINIIFIQVFSVGKKYTFSVQIIVK